MRLVAFEAGIHDLRVVMGVMNFSPVLELTHHYQYLYIRHINIQFKCKEIIYFDKIYSNG